MSHFITGLGVSPQPILDKSPLRQIVAPKFKHVLSKHKRRKTSFNDCWKEELVISKLCKKLSDREYTLLRKQNASQIQHHFAKLKTKLRRQVEPNAMSVSKFFDDHKESAPLNIKSILDKMPLKLSLENKYNSKIVNFAEQIYRSRQINDDKQNYLKWYNRQNNSPIKSPNYTRMSYVFEKLQKKKNTDYPRLNLNIKITTSKDENDAQLYKLSSDPGKADKFDIDQLKTELKLQKRKIEGDNCILVYRKQQQYGPKYKKLKTQGSQL